MSGNKNLPTKNYKLISAQIRLNESKHAEEIQNMLFDRKLKGFHLFCVILFGVFLLDGQLPAHHVKAEIRGVKVLQFTHKDVSTVFKGKILEKRVSTPSRIQLATTHGDFITTEITGYEVAGTKVDLLRTPMFDVSTSMYFPNQDAYVYRWLNFSGNFIFWPLAAFLMSIVCLVTKRFYGSTTLAVISILNFVPFFVVVYKV